MFVARRSNVAARQLLRRQVPRRYGSHAADHHAEPVNESFGRGFFITLAALPVGLAVYKYSTSDASNKPWITRLIEKYAAQESEWEKTNDLHTVAIEQAAHDRHLFHSQRPPLTVDLKCQEIFNAGSPINVPAGGRADISTVAAHYQAQNQQIEEKRVTRLQDGKVVSLYDDDRYL